MAKATYKDAGVDLEVGRVVRVRGKVSVWEGGSKLRFTLTALDVEALLQYERQQEQSGYAESKRRDVPRGETRPETEASHHDPSRPDADRGEAVECALGILDGS